MSHIIVILDCSGSMGEAFHALRKRGKRKYLPREIKIAAAKSSLMDWLQKSEFDKVTIIPFSSRVKRKLTGSLKRNITKIRNFVYGQIADGNTNLQVGIAKAIETAKKDIESSYIQYLIVTDGLSHTMEQDVRLVQTIPISQAVSGILIDPTPEGENHLRCLCVRGSYMSVRDAKGFSNSLKMQDKSYSERIQLSKTASRLTKQNKEIAETLSKSEKEIKGMTTQHKQLEKILISSVKKNKILEENWQTLIHKIADQNVDASRIVYELQKVKTEQDSLEVVVEILEKYQQLLQQLTVSVNYPRLLAKGHTTTVFIQIYPIDRQIKELNRQIRKLGVARRFYNTVLTFGMSAVTKLECPQIKFSDEIIKKFSAGENILKFTAEPTGNANPGVHKATLVIYNEHTGKEYLSQNFDVEIVDFAFRDISRPSLIRAVTLLAGLVFLASFFFTVFRLVDSQIGFSVTLVAALLVVVGLILFKRDYGIANIVK